MNKRILAFDISTNPGVAVLEVKKLKSGIKVELKHVDSIKTSTAHTDAQRYAYIEAFAVKVIHEHGPFDVVLREHFTKGRNKRSTQTVFGAWAAIDAALNKYGYEVVAELTPSEVKKAASGSGNADKAEVEAGVRKRLGLPDDFTFKSDDESDAVAVGLAYLIKKGVLA
ncbi:crossover junction endodeoxyribonuclease RuvC [Bacillus chungangensis]|uniref:Crossover junction endodeoxyribonuclease RuvC n=1 Tax=Bacillus chungangensis TaxID=587633 RepID=A0ABT9WMF1_9BACI|nr:crossover junction endodeoxyribonuclease RuvC [Bacillus chungangensis]MDQ0174426.1 crossover junction endodeoxyribonuclease RuvC [Bacillus chungangensis]